MSRALGLALGVVLDAALGDPQRHHPVAWFGQAAARCERRLYGDSAARGTVFALVTLAPLAALGAVAEATRRRPVLHTALTAATTWACLGVHSLAAEGRAMADRLDADDLAGARGQLSHLCGRDPDALDAPELARATVESLAENTNDAGVATLAWGAVAGMPGLLVHRGANTLDAMVGHHNDRYENFGRPAARLDDALAWLPARLTGALAGAAAPLVGASASGAWRAMIRDHADHPSPNGGWCEAAWAGALGVRLGGRNVYYGHRVEDRGLLGEPGAPRPDAQAVRTASRLVTAVTGLAAVIAVASASGGAAHHKGRKPTIGSSFRPLSVGRGQSPRPHTSPDDEKRRP